MLEYWVQAKEFHGILVADLHRDWTTSIDGPPMQSTSLVLVPYFSLAPNSNTLADLGSQ